MGFLGPRNSVKWRRQIVTESEGVKSQGWAGETAQTKYEDLGADPEHSQKKLGAGLGGDSG